MKDRGLIKNVVYSVAALVAMNGVMQLAVYPYLNRQMGADRFGEVLYLLGIIAIFAPSLGTAANNTRLVLRNQFEVKNGDFDRFLAVGILLACIGGIALSVSYLGSPWLYVIFCLLMAAQTLRYYADVEYRLNLNYKHYFFYYAIMSAGLLAGIPLYMLTHSWGLTLLLGEISAITFVAFGGTVFRRPFRPSAYQGKVYKATTTLMLSYLLYNFILNCDRLLLINIIDSATVTQYYTVSLIGKSFAIIAGPLNSIIISYLTNKRIALTKKQYLKFVLGVTGLGVLSLLACVIATPVFLNLCYPDLYEQVIGLNWIANAAPIACFTASILLTTILTFCSEKWQLVVQLIYAGAFLGACIPLAIFYGLWGFAIGALLANVLRLLIVIVLGIIKASGKRPDETSISEQSEQEETEA